MPTLADTFAEFFANPSPGACHICGTTEDIHQDHVDPLIGDEPWMICGKCNRERSERRAQEKAEFDKKQALLNWIAETDD